jgi:hypothetical protein
MGWLVGSSTRTPVSSISIMAARSWWLQPA